MTTGIVLFVVAALFSCGLAASPRFNAHQPNNDNIPQCMQPPQPGLCLAYFPSFYYNPSTKKCQSFIYGGCKGNLNRFNSEEECMSTCFGKEQPAGEEPKFELLPEKPEQPKGEENADVCKQPQRPGLCYAYLPRFYFNGKKCESFIYGGCDGNENNFQTEAECNKACSTKVMESQPIIQELPTIVEAEASSTQESGNICSQPKQPGLCYAYFPKYYFNGEKCESFVYGGCGGNENNFNSEEECNKACPPKVVESKEKEANQQ